MSEPNEKPNLGQQEEREEGQGSAESTLEVSESVTVQFRSVVSSVTNKPGGEGGTPG